MEIESKNPKILISVYYKGQWVNMPLLYVPEEAVDDDYIYPYQFIILDETEQPLEPKPKRCTKLAYDKIYRSIKATILPWQMEEDELRKICNMNDISLNWVRKEGLQQVFKSSTVKGNKKKRERKCTALNRKDYRKFIKQLRIINKRSALIAEIMWYLNSALCQGDEYITTDEILRLRIQDVDLDDGMTTCISLSRLHHRTYMWLPKRIWKLLCKEIHPERLYVFSNKNGGPILSHNVGKDFRKAGKEAGIKGIVSTLSLRPISKFKRTTNKTIQNSIENHTKRKFEEVSIEEWEMLCNRIPALKRGSGRPPIHDQRVIFNAILSKENTKTPLRKLPNDLSHKAIHSQYRRWREKGVIDAILTARQSI